MEQQEQSVSYKETLYGYSWILKNYAGICIADTKQIWVWVRDKYLSNG